MPSWRSLFIQRILDRVCQLTPFSLTYKFSSRMFMGLFWLSIHLFLVIFLLMQCEQQRHSFFPWQLFAVWAPAACSLTTAITCVHQPPFPQSLPQHFPHTETKATPQTRARTAKTLVQPGPLHKKDLSSPSSCGLPALTTSSGRVFEDKLHLRALIYTNGL